MIVIRQEINTLNYKHVVRVSKLAKSVSTAVIAKFDYRLSFDKLSS